ncbi:hypothetical protein GCM10010911_00160 [Paenibacillus nasutitermitis]|uniref:Uncharacterized protein n=1 Tax=Paenibacillus nasutitermitis TaxID=1652958 RepID=A0A917DLQ8_9BACL|nr:hypothetical protein GCM10010911_00160 [Paenibacillus nasutitermitis]
MSPALFFFCADFPGGQNEPASFQIHLDMLFYPWILERQVPEETEAELLWEIGKSKSLLERCC